jgi:putative ABC transport system permease protein
VIVEGFVLAAASGVLALMLAWWTQALVSTFAIPIEVPQHIDASPDGRVIVFIVLLICVAGVLPGLWPALAAARINVTRVLAAHSATAAGGRPSSLGRWLVGAQTAGSTAFLAIALLFIQSYTNLQSVDPGFARDHLLVAEFSPEHASSEMYAAHLVERAQALPGVVSVALADRAPFFIGFDRETAVWPDSGACAPDNCPRVATYAVESGYFATMGIALTAGRTFSVTEGVSEVVVNGAFARQQWPDGRGVGETLRIGTEGAVATVVGITADTQIRRADREQPAMYLPLTGARRENSLTLIVRTTGSPSALIRPLREAAAALDSGVPMLSLKTMTQRTEVQLWPFRTLSFMFTICGALALVLAVVGLAGLVIHAVSRRTREFGVRLSIGATPRDLIRDVMRDGAKLFAPGLLAGVVIAAGSARLVEAVFVGVNVLNPRTYVAVAVLQGLIVAVTCIAPAVRASRVDPLTTLRAD